MPINPYDQAAWSTYTPLSSQEILQPAMIMNERHAALENEYAGINDELSKVAFIVENEQDPAIKERYNNYMTNLSSARDELMNKGWSNVNRRRMLNLRSDYQSQIQPINLGYQMKAQDVSTYNQMRANDPTYIGQDPTTRTVSDYINNGLQPFTTEGISGSSLTNMAAEYLKPFSQELTGTQLDTLVSDLLYKADGTTANVATMREYVKRYGYKPGTEGHAALMEVARNAVTNATGINNWMDPNQLEQANSYIDLAASQTIGKEQSQFVNTEGNLLRRQAQQDKIAQGQQQRDPTRLPGFNVQPGGAEPFSKRLENIREERSDLIDYANTGNLPIGRREPQRRALYDRAIELEAETRGMTDAELEQFVRQTPFTQRARSGDAFIGGSNVDRTNELISTIRDLRDYNNYNRSIQSIQERYNISPQEAERLAEDYANSTSTLYNNLYIADTEALRRGQDLAFSSTRNSMFNNNQTVTYVDGERKDTKDIPKEIRSDIITKGTIVGHNPYNASLGVSTISVSYVVPEGDKDEGKQYVVEVPDINLSNSYNNTRAVLNTIRASNTLDPTPITLPNGSPATVQSVYENGRWEHLVQIGNRLLSLEQLRELEQGELRKRYFNNSLTPSQLAKYQQTGVIPEE